MLIFLIAKPVDSFRELWGGGGGERGGELVNEHLFSPILFLGLKVEIDFQSAFLCER